MGGAAKNKMVGFKVTAADFEGLKERARREKMTISEYCRSKAFIFSGHTIPVLQLPDGQKISVKELSEADIIFIGREYDNQKPGGNGEKAEKE